MTTKPTKPRKRRSMHDAVSSTVRSEILRATPPEEQPASAPLVEPPLPAPPPPPEIARPAAPPLETKAPPATQAKPAQGIDFDRLAQNVALMVSAGGKVAAAALAPNANRDTGEVIADQLRAMTSSLGKVAEYYLSEPTRAAEAQTALSGQFVQLWAHTLRRMSGEDSAPVVEPPPGDKRFADPSWRDNPLFDFFKEAYLLTTN
jgi:polyhydroxyalkanoate synthase